MEKPKKCEADMRLFEGPLLPLDGAKREPVRYHVPEGARAGACRSCSAPIVWGVSAKGHRVPLSLASLDKERTAVSHFTDCPDAKGWSRKPSKGKPPSGSGRA